MAKGDGQNFLILAAIGAGVYWLFSRSQQAAALTSPVKSPTPPTGTAPIARASTPTGGDAYVIWLQKSLNTLIGAGLTVDGIFGPKTKAAVQKFQMIWQLPATGEVDPATDYYIKSALGVAGYTEQPFNPIPYVTDEY